MDIPPDGNQIRHVVHAPELRVAGRDAVLDPLEVLFEMIEQVVVFGVQELPQAYFFTLDREFTAENDFFQCAQFPLFDIQRQRPVCQHIQPFLGINTDKVERQLLDAQLLPGRALAPLLEIFHDLAELRVVQRQTAARKGIAVQMLDQGIVGLVRHAVQPVAGRQIVQHPQVDRAAEQRRIFVRVFLHIRHKRLVHRAPGAFHQLSGADTVEIDREFLHGQLPQVQPIHDQNAAGQLQLPDGDPVSGGLFVSVAIFNGQPFALMDGLEDGSVDTGHGFPLFPQRRKGDCPQTIRQRERSTNFLLYIISVPAIWDNGCIAALFFHSTSPVCLINMPQAFML